jgi:hypothetical protein
MSARLPEITPPIISAIVITKFSAIVKRSRPLAEVKLFR